MRRMLTPLLVGLLLTAASRLQSQSPYVDHQGLTQKLKALEKAHPQLVKIESIGRSAGGRDIWAITLTTSQATQPPTLLVAATLNAQHLDGGVAALAVAEKLAAQHKKDDALRQLLAGQAIVILPRVSVDGAEAYFQRPLRACATNLRPVDDDRDGLVDEDGPEDLNGDGFITVMRRAEPGGEWMVDPNDGRLLKKADPLKGEQGVYALYPEGRDSDGDGRYNEDPPGGVDINRNFPHDYPDNKDQAGPHMASEPETRAVLDYMVTHRNIGLVLVLDGQDNLRALPRAAKHKPQGNRYNRELVTEMDGDDLAFHKALVETAKTVYPKAFMKANGPVDNAQGAFHPWAYFQYGVLALATPAWLKADSSATAKEGPSDADWLQGFQESGVQGFVEWKPYDHPQLGAVEIGGFVPYAKLLPPQWDEYLLEGHARFVQELAGRLPRLEIAETSIKKQGDGIYQIEVAVRNTGFLPTVLAHAQYAEAVRPTRAALKGEGFQILAGEAHAFLPSLNGSGGTARVRWTVRAPQGTRLTLSMWSEKAGAIDKPLTLE